MKRRLIGLDAGGTKLLAGVVDEDGEVVFRRVYPWGEDPSLAHVCSIVLRACEEARAAMHAPDRAGSATAAAAHADADAGIAAIGVGLPATMDIAAGVPVASRHLPIAGFGFRDWLTGQTGLPVFVDNDATLALLAESRSGAARGATDAVMLTIGTGIGGGLMSGGRLVRGARGAAGEPGHMTIDADGPPCPGDCPGHGCLELYVSGPALASAGHRYAEIGPDYNLGRILRGNGVITPADVVQAARSGDAGAREAVTTMGEKLGIGIASLLNLLDPEVVVIGGGLGSAAGPLLIEPAARVASERALEPAASKARIVAAELGEDAGMLGAAMLAADGGGRG